MKVYLLMTLILTSACVTETSIIKKDNEDSKDVVVDTVSGDSNDTPVLIGVNDNVTGRVHHFY